MMAKPIETLELHYPINSLFFIIVQKQKWWLSYSFLTYKYLKLVLSFFDRFYSYM